MDLPQQSLWKPSATHYWQFFCPNCKTPKAIALHPNPYQKRFFLRIGIFTAFLTLCLWPWFGLKTLVLYAPFWVGFELIYRMWVRTKLHCEACGFDPYLYLQDPHQARSKIDLFWKEKFEAKGIPLPPPVKHRQPEV